MGWAKVDDDEFQAWADKVIAGIRSDKVKKSLENSSMKIGTQLLRNAKTRTPVGETGNLRRSWSVEGPKYSGKAFLITIKNDADYASYVEEGHRTRGGKSWVQGVFMMKSAVEEVNGQVSTLAAPFFRSVEELING